MLCEFALRLAEVHGSAVGKGEGTMVTKQNAAIQGGNCQYQVSCRGSEERGTMLDKAERVTG
jgi:hypothetical protein